MQFLSHIRIMSDLANSLQTTAAAFLYHYATRGVYNLGVMFLFWLYAIVTSSIALRSYLRSDVAVVCALMMWTWSSVQ